MLWNDSLLVKAQAIWANLVNPLAVSSENKKETFPSCSSLFRQRNEKKQTPLLLAGILLLTLSRQESFPCGAINAKRILADTLELVALASPPGSVSYAAGICKNKTPSVDLRRWGYTVHT